MAMTQHNNRVESTASQVESCLAWKRMNQGPQTEKPRPSHSATPELLTPDFSTCASAAWLILFRNRHQKIGQANSGSLYVVPGL
jgi:hypothetical protein